jgi:L-asparagine oxygenase
MVELPTDYQFSGADRAALTNTLLHITTNPYKDYGDFATYIDRIIERGAVPASFVEFCENKREADTLEEPYVFLSNCPIDDSLPYLDFDEPVTRDVLRRNEFYTPFDDLTMYKSAVQLGEADFA